MWNEVVGDAHFIPIGVSAERQQRRVLRFPSEPTDSPLARPEVAHHRRAAAHTVSIAIVRILEGKQRLVRDRLDQAGPEHGDRHAAHDDRRIRGNHRLAGVSWNREEMKERFTRSVEGDEFAIRAALAGSHFRDRARAADGRYAVAHRATRRVERWPQSLI